MTYLGSGLNHMLFEFGHLNASKYFKCPSNPKLKCSMLDIFYTVGMFSLVIFERVSVFLEKRERLQKNRKEK